jgi:hypothetical protein
MGLEELLENDTPVRGKMTCFLGHSDFYLFGGVYNEDTGTSYLMQFGGWVAGDDGQWQRVDAWHGSLSEGYPAKMTAMASTTFTAPTNHLRLVIGFSDGTVVSSVLPCTVNPAGCDQYRWSTAEGQIYLPTFTGKFESNIKPLRNVVLSGLVLDPDNYAEFDYKLSPSATSWEVLPGLFNVLPNKTIAFPEGSTTVLADFRVRLTSNAETASPQVRGLGVTHDLHTELRQVRVIDVLCADGLVDREGGPLAYGAVGIREILQEAHDIPGGVVVVTADEEARMMKIVGWREVMAWDRRLETWRSAVRLTLNDVSAVDRVGFYWRLEELTYGDLEAYTYGELEEL